LTGEDDWGLWSFRAVVTQDNVAGGALVLDIAAGVGNVVHITDLTSTFSGTNTQDIDLIDEDANIVVKYVDLASGAGQSATIPRANVAVDSTTSSLLASSLEGVWLAGSDVRLSISTGGAAQTNTLTLAFTARVMNAPGTVVATRSGGTPNLATPTVNEVY
jgi:hypothetical protein